jgi:hypothetical protein
MNDLEEYLEIRRKAERAQRDVDKAVAKIEMETDALKAKCGCASLEEAGKKLEKMKRIRSAKREGFLAEKERFEKKWGNRL